MDRQYIVAGNWKMNKHRSEALQLTQHIAQQSQSLPQTIEVVLAPPSIHLETVQTVVKDLPQVQVAAQNCHQASHGAYTGEVSAPMLEDLGLGYVILGHSERREYFHEDAALLAKKVNAALASNLKVIFCCGEPLEVREAGTQNAYVQQQLEESLWQRSAEDLSRIVIAYEPIWAIGTGKTATPAQAQAMHHFIRARLAEQYGATAAQQVPLLYGGSCKPSNAAELFAQPDIDGALVGGASLQADDFMAIVAARLA